MESPNNLPKLALLAIPYVQDFHLTSYSSFSLFLDRSIFLSPCRLFQIVLESL